MANPGSEAPRQKIASVEYRKTTFDFILLADDDAVRAWNEFMTLVYSQDLKPASPLTDESRRFLTALGRILLSLRRSLGNKTTSLTALDMLRGTIKDLRLEP